MKSANERKSSSLDCDVGLGLKMQTESSCTRAMSFPFYQYQFDSSGNLTHVGGDGVAVGGGGGGGGSTFFNTSSNKVACGTDIYAAGSAVLPRTWQNSDLRASEGGMTVSGKPLFTSSQLQELERQKMIHSYMMASIPVPPELILPISRTPCLAAVPQSNTSSLDSRFSSSRSDPEPWRCKRTDGKKWRCSRDVAPDQKYCERHAHKSKPRSRKPVEVSSHNATNNFSQNPLILPTNTQPLPRPTSQFPTMAPARPYDQTRCIEWFMRGGSSSSSSGTIPVSSCNQQQWQQVMQTSSRLELMNRDNTDHNKNVSVFQTQEKQDFMSLNPCVPERLENHHQLSNVQFCNSILDSKMTSLQESRSLNPDRTQTTRHFIDAWEKDGLDGISNKGLSASWSKKFSPSSLTLSMSGLNGIDEDNEESHFGIGMINSDRDSDGILKSQWLNPVSWMNSPPGGPLGEALCLGNSSTTRSNSNLTSPRVYSNSNTNSSSCSKSSCDDGSHALNFIG